MPTSRPAVRAGGLALAAVLAATLAAGYGPARASATEPISRWHTIDRGPLTPRLYAKAVWTGTEVLVIGGDRAYCEDQFECAPKRRKAARDGAAYNPRTNTWRSIADAPAPDPADAALVGSTVYAVFGDLWDSKVDAVAAYSLADDSWTALPAPPAADLRLASAAGRLFAYHRGKSRERDVDYVWKPGVRKWSPLPAFARGTFYDRQFVGVGNSIVVLGSVRADAGIEGEPGGLSAERFDLATRTWTPLRKPGGIAGSPWYAEGDEVVTGRTWHHPCILDPAGRGTWSKVAERPSIRHHPRAEFWWADAGGGGYVVAGRYALEVATRKWTKLSAPEHLRAGLEGPAVTWAGDRFFVWGGSPTEADGTTIPVPPPRNRAWTWSPTPVAAPPSG